MAFQNILVPIDFTEPSLRALRLAVGLARSVGARITLLHVESRALNHPAGVNLGAASEAVFEELRHKIEEGHHRTLRRIADEEIPPEVPSEPLLRIGEPAEAILAQVQSGGHDLVVMGSHSRTGLTRMLLGSIAEKVLHASSVPVMLTH